MGIHVAPHIWGVSQAMRDKSRGTELLDYFGKVQHVARKMRD
jgi:hypothetical protein